MTSQTFLRAFFSLAFASAMHLFSMAEGTDGVTGKLLLEGRILVEGGGPEDVTISVFCDNVEQGQVNKGLKNFEMELALGHTYHLVFAGSGCVTKELVFDTNASAGIPKDGVFNFRFQVSMAAVQAAAAFEYDGPVAIIRFNPEEGEFGYDRQHATPAVVKARRERKEAKPFVDPSSAFAAWVELKRTQQ